MLSPAVFCSNCPLLPMHRTNAPSRVLGCFLAVVLVAGWAAPAAAQSAPDAVADSAAAAIESESTTSGTQFRTPVHVLAWEDGTESGVQAQAVVNEERGYAAFALRVLVEEGTIEAGAARTVQLEADGKPLSIRGRNVSVRDTSVVIVVRRQRFATLAGADTARLLVGNRTAALPQALQRQMRAIMETCTQPPVGCTSGSR